MEEKRFAEDRDLGKKEYQNVPAEMGLEMGPKASSRIAERSLLEIANEQFDEFAQKQRDEYNALKLRKMLEKERDRNFDADVKLNEAIQAALGQKKAEKPSNPKDILGSAKVPLHLFPSTAIVGGCLAFLEGMLKYGRGNFRVVGVRASIYIDAEQRHMKAFAEGQDIDPDSGLEHLWKALACIAILIDAKAAGKLRDDRMVKGGYDEMMKTAEKHVEELKARYADKNPRHYSIADDPGPRE